MQLHIYNDKVIILNILLFSVACSKAQQNVGVGTAYPSAKLHVKGTLKITDGNQGIGKVLTRDVNGLSSWKATEKLFFKIDGVENSSIIAAHKMNNS